MPIFAQAWRGKVTEGVRPSIEVSACCVAEVWDLGTDCLSWRSLLVWHSRPSPTEQPWLTSLVCFHLSGFTGRISK